MLTSAPKSKGDTSVVIVSPKDHDPLAERLGARLLKPEQLLSCTMTQQLEA